MAIPILSGLWEKIVDRGGAIISEVVTDKDLAKKLEHEFRMRMEQNASDFRSMELQAEQKMFEAQQQTIQAELHQSDIYTKRTRPKVARQSWYVGGTYALTAAILPAMPVEWGLRAPDFSWEVFIALIAPALTYMGVRGFEKWKHGPRHGE